MPEDSDCNCPFQMIVVYRNIPDMRENPILGCAVKIETPALLLVPMLLLRVNTTYHANHTADTCTVSLHNITCKQATSNKLRFTATHSRPTRHCVPEPQLVQTACFEQLRSEDKETDNIQPVTI